MPQRYEHEIEEIVRKAGGLQPRTPFRQRILTVLRLFQRRPARGLTAPARWVTPTKIGVTGAVLLIVGAVLRSAPIAISALAVLLAAYLLAISRSKGTFQETTGYDKTWRGRPMDRPAPGRRGWFPRWFGKER